jgi:hypothetical protein
MFETSTAVINIQQIKIKLHTEIDGSFHLGSHYCFATVTNIGMYQKISVKFSNVTPHGNSAGGSQALTQRQTWRN